jgi:hypothetical protein
MKILRRKSRGPLTVAILGSGPAGLFAAQAVYDTGNVAYIYSRGERSALYGAQYLHAPVPNLECGNKRVVDYTLWGTPDEYRNKVYGDQYGDVMVSPEALATRHGAWDIRAAYSEAWDRFSGLIHRTEVKREWLLEGFDGFDLVVWSIPLPDFCLAGHQFHSREIWAQGDAPELGLFCSVTVQPWTVIVNGEDSPRWYRASNVFEHRTVEWPDGPKPPVENLARVRKPVFSNCDCWQKIGDTPVIRVGRYGTWTKGELSHQSYQRTFEAIKAL